MKNLILGSIALFAANTGFASTPNHYDCTSENGETHFTYSTTSIIGKPMMNMTFEGDRLRDSGSTRIMLHEGGRTFLGQEVVVQVVRPGLADAPTQTFQIMIPTVVLRGNDKVAKFKTVVTYGLVGGFRAPPYAIENIQSATMVDCTADQVLF